MTTDKLGLSPQALQFATECPRLWEHRLFGQVIIDDIERVKKHFQQGQSTQVAIADKIVSFPSLMEWMSKKNNELLDILNQLTELVNSNHDDAFGLPGVSGNVENLVGYSRKIVTFYYHTVKWLQAVQNTPVAPHFEEIHQELVALPKGVIECIERFGPELFKQVDDITNSPPSDKLRVLSLILKVELSTDRLSSALERLTNELEESGLSTEKFDQFKSDYRLKHVVLKNIKYWDSENEETHYADLELFGHCFEATIENGRESIKSVSTPGTEIQYVEMPLEQGQGFMVMIGDASTSFVVSKHSLDLLKQHYQEINKNVLKSQEDFKNKVVSIVSRLLTDKELVEMARNFIAKSPLTYYIDIEYLLLIEFLVETTYTPIGRLLLSYPKENRGAFIQANSEFIENNDIVDVESYFDQLKMFTQVLKEKNLEAEMYATYTFLYNVVIEHLAQEWEKQYKQYFMDINGLSLEEAIERYCSIETINHQDMTVAGVFIYYLIKHGKFGKDNHNYFDCLNIFLPKINKVLESKKYKDFVGKLKTTSSKNRYTIDDVDLMNGQEFEKFVAELFSKMGFETKITKATGDQGIDIIASKDGDKIGIQAKCYSSTLGNGAIQEVAAGKNYYRLDKAMVITNNFFTDSARQLARANSIILWDRNNLMEKIERFFNS